MPAGRLVTAAVVVEDSGVVAFTAVVLVVDTSGVEEASVVVVSEAVAALAQGTPALEPGAAEVESASAECAPQVEFRTLLAQDPASLHLGILRTGSLSIMDELPNR